LVDDILKVMETVGLARVNLISIPDLQSVNQNPALLRFKAYHPDRVTICGALDYTQVFADPARAPEILAAQIAALRRVGSSSSLRAANNSSSPASCSPCLQDCKVKEGYWPRLQS
jgi:hypothetical protein